VKLARTGQGGQDKADRTRRKASRIVENALSSAFKPKSLRGGSRKPTPGRIEPCKEGVPIAPAIDPRQAAQPQYWTKLFTGMSDAYRNLPMSQKAVDVTDFLIASGAAEILDVGCGLGRWCIYMAKRGLRPTGVDIVELAVQAARKWAETEGVDASFVVASATSLPFPKASFDGYVGSRLLDHLGLDNARKAVEEMTRVLRPGGVFFLSFDGPDTMPSPHEVMPDGSWYYTDGPFAGLIWRHFTDAEITGLLEGLELTGFTITETGARWVFGRVPEVS